MRNTAINPVILGLDLVYTPLLLVPSVPFPSLFLLIKNLAIHRLVSAIQRPKLGWRFVHQLPQFCTAFDQFGFDGNQFQRPKIVIAIRSAENLAL